MKKSTYELSITIILLVAIGITNFIFGYVTAKYNYTHTDRYKKSKLEDSLYAQAVYETFAFKLPTFQKDTIYLLYDGSRLLKPYKPKVDTVIVYDVIRKIDTIYIGNAGIKAQDTLWVDDPILDGISVDKGLYKYRKPKISHHGIHKPLNVPNLIPEYESSPLRINP